MQPATQRSAQEIVARVASLAKQVRAYESESLQAEARQLIPWDAVETYAAEEDAGLGKSPGEYRGRAALAKGLMRWFKKDFFKWTNKPSCPNPSCGRGGPFQEPIGMLAPSTEEREHGWASRVEGYKCKECSTVHRFPRYNNPAVLLQTRKGRCGEWANCFTLICRAAGFEARHVTDWTDHVWTEVRESEKIGQED
jgi:peptide-N4-(N-acetyl-beta-glucosaminyl)asparagine amidase